MEYEIFVQRLIDKLNEKAKWKMTLERKMVHKVNVDREALVVKYPNSIVAPTVYLDDKYEMLQQNCTVDEIAENILATLKNIRIDDLVVPELSQESAEKNLYCVLINAADNKELLKDIPYEKLEDLAIVAKYKVGENASFLVTDKVCESLQMTSEEVLETAYANVEKQKFECRPMAAVMREMMLKEGMDEEYVDELLHVQATDCPIYVLTNQTKVEGAVAVASQKALKKAYETIGEEFFILPSSRHEVLLVPKSANATVKELQDMVHEVNATEVSAEDKLSDNVYEYDVMSKRISLAKEPVAEKVDTFLQSKEKMKARSC